nr:DUF262 domain-containing protein [Coleofasciculus sp. FACHB-T130]
MKNLNTEFPDEDTEIDDNIWSESGEEDVEPEEEEIDEPFDPTKIRVDTQQITIGLIVRKIKSDEIDLTPEFQRQAVWNNIAKSRLIESILIRIPIPSFYIDATNEAKWLVIDGLQRLTTLKEFILDKQLKLTGLQSFTQFNGKIYDEIPRNYQRRIEETPLTVILIEKGTPSEFKQAIFERINTSAVALSAQEIRHALNQGKATKLLERLAVSVEFERATDKGIKANRMADRECILRVLTFLINSKGEVLKNKTFNKLLDKTMVEINHMSDEKIRLLENEFLRLMNVAFEIFGKDAFRKLSKEIRYPLNKALFEAWSVNLHKLSEEQVKLLKQREDVLKQKIIDFTNDGNFDNPIYSSKGNIKIALRRMSDIEHIIEAVLS